MTTKEKAISLIQSLGDDISLDDVIDRLYLLRKIELELKGDAAHFIIELRPATPYFRLDLIRRCAKRLEQSNEAVHHQRAIEKKLNPSLTLFGVFALRVFWLNGAGHASWVRVGATGCCSLKA